MNFILLTDYYYPIVKSGSIIVGDLVNELSQQGHNLTIVTFTENQSKNRHLSSQDRSEALKLTKTCVP